MRTQPAPYLQCVSYANFEEAYGVHLGKELFPFSSEIPLKESLPRIPEPYASQMFYYHLLDRLRSLSQGRKWTWCDVRPDVIVCALFRKYAGENKSDLPQL